MEKEKIQTKTANKEKYIPDIETRNLDQSSIFKTSPGSDERFSPEYADERNHIAYVMMKNPQLKIRKGTEKEALGEETEAKLSAFADAFNDAIRYYDENKKIPFFMFFKQLFEQKEGSLLQAQKQDKNKQTFGEVSKIDRQLIRAITKILDSLHKDISALSEYDYSIITERLNIGRSRIISERTVRKIIECMSVAEGAISVDQESPDGENVYGDFIGTNSRELENLFTEQVDMDVHPVLFVFKMLDLEQLDRRKDYRLIFDKSLMKYLKQYDAHKGPLPKNYSDWTKVQKEHMHVYDALADIEEELFGYGYLVKSYLYYVLLPNPDREETLDSIAKIDASGYRKGRKFSNESIANYEGKSKYMIEKRSKDVRKKIKTYLDTLTQKRQQ